MTTRTNASSTSNTAQLRDINDNRANRYGNWALVTGATSGIGAAMSRRLAAQGVNVVAVARNSTRLDALAEELSKTYDVAVQTFSLDMSAPGAVKQLDEATAHLDIGMVTLNAGTETSGEFVQSDLALHTKLVLPPTTQQARPTFGRLARL